MARIVIVFNSDSLLKATRALPAGTTEGRFGFQPLLIR